MVTVEEAHGTVPRNGLRNNLKNYKKREDKDGVRNVKNSREKVGGDFLGIGFFGKTFWFDLGKGFSGNGFCWEGLSGRGFDKESLVNMKKNKIHHSISQISKNPQTSFSIRPVHEFMHLL